MVPEWGFGIDTFELQVTAINHRYWETPRKIKHQAFL